MRARKPKGSVVFNRLRATWNFLWCEGNQGRSRKLGPLVELPTKADALRKAEAVRRDLRLQRERAIVTVRQLVEQFRVERMPERTKRLRKPHSLTEDEFRKFLAQLEEPIRTIALLCVSFGLRISEALALKWSDVDWLSGTLQIQQGIVRQHVGAVKTDKSQQKMSVDEEMLAVLKGWHQITQFPYGEQKRGCCKAELLATKAGFKGL